MSQPRVHTLANGATLVCDPMSGLQSFALSVVAGRGALEHHVLQQVGHPAFPGPFF